MSDWLVVGLGNPGPRYANTRHNVGRMVVEALAHEASASFASSALKRYDAAVTRISPAGLGVPSAQAGKCVLLESRTFMNESGVAVAKAVSFYGLKPENVIVVHDELDLDFGRLKMKFGGGDNGHNGLKSIRAHLHTGDFYRLRFGVGRPPGHQDPADFVLSGFNKQELKDLDTEVQRAADAVVALMNLGLADAQNRFNS
ncbi:MAG: aminoacyl-tRNA hydrolase [Propionibacteriaceae bacterium]|jgi:PTH1 family peptidyl-tRNA hydrolase|nr:aminoacyl-tRNA hydrolase [Propionibacteriaceae bacterium]